MASKDPDFEAKAADIIGLYLNPPQHAAIFCVDQKSAIQALDRLITYMKSKPGVWFATLEQVAEYVKAQQSKQYLLTSPLSEPRDGVTQ